MKTFLSFVLAATVLAVLGCAGSDKRETVRDVWWLTESSSGSELQIKVFIGSSSCTSFNRLEVNENEEKVEILAYVDSVIDPKECTSDLALEKMTVSLEQPLGSRVLEGCIPPKLTSETDNVQGEGFSVLPKLTDDCLTIVNTL